MALFYLIIYYSVKRSRILTCLISQLDMSVAFAKMRLGIGRYILA
jgi:hypothetical protein